MKTSRTEIIDITKAWLALSLAFTFVYSGLQLLGGGFSINALLSINFLTTFVVSLLTAGLGFLLHEMAHKFVAQKYGCQAEFRAFDQMLYLAVILSIFMGFIFAAPGAVMISGMITRKENGLISLAGPATNYVLAMIFLFLRSNLPVLAGAFSIGFFINMWLGLFNMLPFWNFDGKKIYHWNQGIWLAMVLFGGYFVFFF